MVKINLSDINVPELIPDIWSPLNEEQREFLANHFTLQNYKKNEIIHCEGETPTCLMCLLNGKVKIYKDGVGGRSQIIRMIKPTEYFGYRPYFPKSISAAVWQNRLFSSKKAMAWKRTVLL